MNKHRILDMKFINDYIRENFPNGNLIGVEIGSLALVLSGNFNKFYCVDPWRNGGEIETLGIILIIKD